MFLMKSQKNEILRLIEAYGFYPNDFEWLKLEKGDILSHYYIDFLKHKETGYFFQFDVSGEEHHSNFSPGGELEHEYADPGSWENQKGYFEKWLNYLRREIEQPDLWDEIRLAQEAFEKGLDPYTQNKTFNNDQITQIEVGINQILDYIKSLENVSEEQYELVKGELEYLKDASKRLVRKDWILMSITTITAIVINLSLSTEEGRVIFKILEKAVQGLIKFLPKITMW